MEIWIDADACPVVIKEILFRAAERTGLNLTLVANHGMRIPPAPNIRFLPVESGFDVADNEIVHRCESGDLVITSDVPLAAEIIEKGGLALSPRGEAFTKENIRGRLNMRDFMDTMRSSGIEMSRTAPMSKTDRQTFANGLDRILARHTPKT